MVMSGKTRLSSQDWLIVALDALYEKGIESVRVEALAQKMNVTKGSFYWHFKDRKLLLSAMVDYWEQAQNALVMNFESPMSDPAARLMEVFRFIHIEKDIRHDIAMRYWSVHNPYAAKP